MDIETDIRKERAFEWQCLANILRVVADKAESVAYEYRFTLNNTEHKVEDFLDAKNSCIKFMEENDFCDFRL